ncbi:unnamed protein product [Linum tenue]|uniref:Uncharacterized protein n=1 Tax=Linum tenue TaxID=586396 RepID=A0AAV0MDL5_9ROSI|nr:unnamed protein product [Linum tenue]
MITGQLIGKTIWVDRATKWGAHGNFAHVCVEVDLTQPFLSQYQVEGITYPIQYEGLKDVFEDCGKYGKPIHRCNCTVMGEENKSATVECVQETQIDDPMEGRVYGDCMTVKKKT